jgi:nucleoside-diphosphate-sugar epimerase
MIEVSMLPQRVLIAGCGYVGCALAADLLRRGCEVWALRRSPGALPEGTRPLTADLRDAAQVAACLPPALDAVVYSASPDDGSAAAYEAAYRVGLQGLLDAARASSPDLRRVLLTSSTGVYPQADGAWVDEETPTPAPAGSPVAALIDAERWLLDAFPGRAASLRLAGIYGPGRDRLIRMAARGEAVCYDEKQYTNRIHRDDAAAALAHLLAVPDLQPIYIGADADPADWSDVMRWLCQRLAVPPPPTTTRADASPRQRRSNKRCNSARLMRSGLALRYPTFREGYDALIRAGASAPTP